MDKFQSFVHKFLGVPNTGDTGANKGQCVGLIQEWINVFNLPQVWGHAKDIYDNAPESQYLKFENKAGSYPIKGDIFCYNSSWGGGYGHIGVIVSSDPKEDSYTIFEQNLPTGMPPVITKRKNWNGVIGWLRIKDYKPEEDNFEEQVKALEKKLNNLNSKLDSKDKLIKTLETSDKSLRKALRASEEQIISLKEEHETTIKELNREIEELKKKADQGEPTSPPTETQTFWELIKILIWGRGD